MGNCTETLLLIPDTNMIITGIENELIILNDTNLSTIKQINHKFGDLSSGIYHEERDIIYLGMYEGLIEFDKN